MKNFNQGNKWSGVGNKTDTGARCGGQSCNPHVPGVVAGTIIPMLWRQKQRDLKFQGVRQKRGGGGKEKKCKEGKHRRKEGRNF